jgi:hypothetical protein
MYVEHPYVKCMSGRNMHNVVPLCSEITVAAKDLEVTGEGLCQPCPKLVAPHYLHARDTPIHEGLVVNNRFNRLVLRLSASSTNVRAPCVCILK